MSDVKKLRRSVKDKKILGVCAGFAEYFDIDATVMRIIFVILFFAGCIGLLAYLICALIMPEDK